MATAKRARVAGNEKLNPWTCRVVCEMEEPAELPFTGGQYIIVNSGVTLPNGKMGKRAYSIPSPDADAGRFELIVRQIPNGVGSGFIHGLEPGMTFEFSGPWGKFLPSSALNGARILVAATDTGITAALGLLRGASYGRHLGFTDLVWFVESEDYFIPWELVRAWIPRELSSAARVFIPRVGEATRSDAACADIRSRVSAEAWERVYLSGDGHVLTRLRDFFMSQGCSEDRVLVETFFHHSELKTASAG
jgi:ferredoxin-NADP reductase